MTIYETIHEYRNEHAEAPWDATTDMIASLADDIERKEPGSCEIRKLSDWMPAEEADEISRMLLLEPEGAEGPKYELRVGHMQYKMVDDPKYADSLLGVLGELRTIAAFLGVRESMMTVEHVW